MRPEISVDEFTAALKVVTHFCEDFYMGSSSLTQMLIDAPIKYSFCDANKDNLSEETIVMMGLQILNKLYSTPYWFMVDEWIDRFKESVLKYLLIQELKPIKNTTVTQVDLYTMVDFTWKKLLDVCKEVKDDSRYNSKFIEALENAKSSLRILRKYL